MASLPGSLRITTRPALDPQSKEIVFSDVDVSVPCRDLTAVLGNVAIGVLTLFLDGTVRLSFADEIEAHQAALRRALNRQSTRELRV